MYIQFRHIIPEKEKKNIHIVKYVPHIMLNVKNKIDLAQIQHTHISRRINK
jgi:hypothetical protein